MRRKLDADLASRVRSYRGGYLPSERREIEAELFDGQLAGVVATTALELGIDVGGLDACVLDGFPGTDRVDVAAGGACRARRTQRSLAVLVAGDDQLDQWLMAHPREVFTRPPEPAVINPSNPFVLLPAPRVRGVTRCRSALDDERWWGDDLDEGVRQLVLDDRLVLRNRRAVWSGRGAPAPGIGLRSGAADEYRIADDDGRSSAPSTEARAFEVVHPGAIYLHQGQTFRVVVARPRRPRRDRRAQRRRRVHAGALARRTSQILATEATRADRPRAAAPRRGRGRRARSSATSARTPHAQRRSATSRSTCRRPGSSPGRSGTRSAPDVLAAARLSPEPVPGTLHAVEHAGIGILPLFTICDRWDVGGVSTAHPPTPTRPTIVIYDGYPGGAGIAELGYGAADGTSRRRSRWSSACPCRAGCPSCVQHPSAATATSPSTRRARSRLLRAVLA